MKLIVLQIGSKARSSNTASMVLSITFWAVVLKETWKMGILKSVTQWTTYRNGSLMTGSSSHFDLPHKIVATLLTIHKSVFDKARVVHQLFHSAYQL